MSKDALRLGCAGIGYTIYPGTANRRVQYEQISEIAHEAKANGLVVVIWSYARGAVISAEGETALDVIAYSAHIAAELGAHIIKVKLPSANLEVPAAKKAYEQYNIPRNTLTERVQHVVQSTFNRKRIVIFSGGAKKDDDQTVLDEASAIRAGGGFGSIIGRNVFQRPRSEALALLDGMMQIYGA